MSGDQKPTLEDVEKIIKYYRKSLNNKNTSILRSYFIENEKPTLKELQNLTRNEEKFDEFLLDYNLETIFKKDLPNFNNGRSYLAQMDFMFFLSNELDQYFFSDNNMALSAKRETQKYVFPSGKEIEYSLLKNEVSANMSINIPALGNSIKKYEIVVRENSLNYLTSLALNNKKQLKIDLLNETEIKKGLLGVMISHEHAEINISDIKKIGQYQAKVELMAEINSVKFLKENKFDMYNYKLFHKLRGNPQNPEDLSGLISTNNYSPSLAYIKLCPSISK